MAEAQSPAPSVRLRRSFRSRRALSRVLVAGGTIIGALAVAAPSWAGPITGC